MKIYTKKGDTGETVLIGGTKVQKNHARVETYGTIDELNSYIGLVRDCGIDRSYKDLLGEIQDRLFTIGSHVASDPETSRMTLPDLNESDVVVLEESIDAMEKDLPEMKNFILPGGHQTVSFIHIARCVCRRAERLAVALNGEGIVDILIIKYLNRLSDYLFVLARKVGQDLDIEEVKWNPRQSS